MTKDEIFALIERVEKACPPECQVEIVPTKQSEEIWLVIVQFLSAQITPAAWTPDSTYWESEKLKSFFEENPALKKAYLWEKQTVHNLHYEKILPLLDDAAHFRAVYCHDRQFVFYAHTFGCFDDCANRFDYVGIKSRENEDIKYVGTCRHSDFLIEHLMVTRKEL
ncbi:MAG: hypothetical protein IKR92_00385 [Alphaproteobacteria bacterium]|nr:hypothetical protein [Alphaproteobacteria bacterium]